MIQKLEISRGQFATLLAAIILVSLIVVGWSGLVQSGEIVLMILVVTVYAGIFPFLLGAAIQATFRSRFIPAYAAWALAFILVASQRIFAQKTTVRVLEQDLISILVSFLIIGIFINAGIKSCRTFYEAIKTKSHHK